MSHTISDKQKHALALLENPSMIELFMGGSGGGPQPLDALVKTPSGYTTIGSLKVGDAVCSYSGGVAFVVDIPYEGIDPIVRLDTRDGCSVTASANHLFPVQLVGEERPQLRKVSEIVKAFNLGQEQWLFRSDNGNISTVKLSGYCPTGVNQVRCISVSTLDGLYITNNDIVTHNSKTFTMCMMALIIARQYPGARMFVGRKTLKSLRQSFIQTLISKVHPMFGLAEEAGDYHYSAQLNEVHYKNGSVIIFGELMRNPSDPDFARFGSLEIDIAFIEEAGEVTLEAKNAIKGRVGRGVMSQKYGIPGKLILSGNPSQNFLRGEYYEPYSELGGGEFQKWQIGETEVKLYRKGTNKLRKTIPLYRAFLRMSVYQNPFIPKSYIDTLRTLPRRERKRLLEGDWDYADDDNSLFKSGLIDKAITYELPQPTEKFMKVIGADISDKGGDATVFSLIDNGVLIAQKKSSVQMNWDESSEEPLSYLIANELIEFAQRNGFTQANARNIAVESNGVGVGVRDALRLRGWNLSEYVATGKSRSQGYYNLMLNMDSGQIKIYKDLETLTQLRKELGVHTYEMENQEPKVLKKDKIKQTLGHSPDVSDSFMIANWMWDRKANPQRDPKRNPNRISW